MIITYIALLITFAVNALRGRKTANDRADEYNGDDDHLHGC